MLVDGEDVDAAGGQGLLSAVGHAVSLRDDSTLTRRDAMLPIGIDADTQHARIVMSTHTHTHKRRETKRNMNNNSFLIQTCNNICHRLVTSDKTRRNNKGKKKKKTVHWTYFNAGHCDRSNEKKQNKNNNVILDSSSILYNLVYKQKTARERKDESERVYS